jgi:hypothetical protein
MSTTQFTNVQDFFIQGTNDVGFKLFENNAHTYNAFKKYTGDIPVTLKGWKVPLWTTRPGGHTSYLPSQSDFNQATPPNSGAMYIYPTYYALPIQLAGSLIRSYNKGGADAVESLGQFMEQYNDAATKRINYYCIGDGSGALAYAATTLASTGAGQTLTCSTTAGSVVAGQTKGGYRLDSGSYYQAIDETTGNPRGVILVTTKSATAPTVTVLSGSVTSGDPIVDVGGYRRAMRGCAWLISNVNRDLQGVSTATEPDLNSPFIDNANQPFTPAVISNLKASLQTRQNTSNAANSMVSIMTPGQYQVLRKQGYNFRMDTTNGKAAVQGVASEYQDGDTTFVQDADMDDDRNYMFKGEFVKMFENMPFGNYNLDGMEMRMQLGVNSSGSDDYQMAVGICANPGILSPRTAAVVRRLKITGVTTQVTAGL